MRWLSMSALVIAASLLSPLAARADQPHDRTSFGGDTYVRQGEVVADVAAFGGSVRVDGEVLGNVASFGGDVVLGPTAVVHGNVDAAGGRIEMLPGARLDGGTAIVPPLPALRPVDPVEPEPHHEHESGGPMHGLLLSAMLFLFALLLTSAVPERMSAMHVAIIREPGRSIGTGLLGFAGAAIVLVALVLTIVGIPLALAMAVLLPIATYVGLAAAATVIGAALPFERLRGRPVLQILAGCGVLFVVSQVPALGTLVLGVVACAGLGALIRTRFRNVAEAPSTGEGPYRTASA
jgi:hypothetical protein